MSVLWLPSPVLLWRPASLRGSPPLPGRCILCRWSGASLSRSYEAGHGGDSFYPRRFCGTVASMVSGNQCKFQAAKCVSALLVQSDSAPAGILQCAPRSEHSPVHFPLVSARWGNTSLHAQLADRVHRSLREVEERPQLPRISPQGRSLFDAIARGGEQRVLGFGGCLQ